MRRIRTFDKNRRRPVAISQSTGHPIGVVRRVHKTTSVREYLKDWIAILQSILTILAILLGGAWFLYQETLKPELKLEHVVTKRRLQGASNVWLISVEVIATNTGKVRERLHGGTLNVVQVNPLPGSPIFDQPMPLFDLQLDPGESDQALFRTFQVSDARSTIEIQSRYPFPTESSIGSFLPSSWVASSAQPVWHHDSILDLENSKQPLDTASMKIGDQ
jgi:hypothetical protein